MGFAIEHIKIASDQLDRVQISIVPSVAEEPSKNTAASEAAPDTAPSPRLQHLQASIDSLSVTLATKPALLHSKALVRLLKDVFKSEETSQGVLATSGPVDSDFTIEKELEWILVGKAAAQTQALILDALIQKTVPLSSEIHYWRSVLDTYPNTALYSLQTSPIRLWKWSKGVYREVREREVNVAEGWRKFYGVVRTVIRERSAANVRTRIVSPLVLVRGEIQEKRDRLNRARLLNAGGIGYLLSNGINSERLDIGLSSSESKVASSRLVNNWKGVIARTISALDALLGALNDPDVTEETFEAAVANSMSEEEFECFYESTLASRRPLENTTNLLEPIEAAARLQNILQTHIPSFSDKATKTLRDNRRPSRLIRYWIPAIVLLSSYNTIFQYFANRKDSITNWIQDLGTTLIDFWANWVIEPTKKVIGTIRHDESSEISIMSKRSLDVDRASLERMVVDFAIDTPAGSSLSASQIESIKANIQEGDLSPVLRVYEKELQSPLYGTLRGNLIRALLIQVQKTKVDIEVAMGGIDSLLKSQELVFGFIGLTPGILVTIGLVRWLRSLSSERQSNIRGQKQTQSLTILRNIDRILTGSPQTDTGVLSFKEYGLLVCEALTLRARASKTFPAQTFQDFLQDFDDLIDNHSGVGRQVRVADRIRWAYSRWL